MTIISQPTISPKINFPTMRRNGFDRAADFIDAYHDRGVWSVPADDMPPPSGAPLQPVRMVWL